MLSTLMHTQTRYLSYGFSNASATGYIGLRVLDAYVGDNPQDAGAKIPFAAHKRITIATDPTTDAEKYALISVPGVEPLPRKLRRSTLYPVLRSHRSVRARAGIHRHHRSGYR